MDSAVCPVHDEDGEEMGREADAAHGLTDGEAEFDECGGGDHEKEIGRAVHGRFADVPDDAVSAREVLGVAHDHGGVFEGRDGEINKGERIIESGE
ncbi:MAG: hypothetical protein KPEEDBHJ_02490 [Anaerolineales bacterium]|nr:hypothetical protein [Anaerolineales bacterium]